MMIDFESTFKIPTPLVQLHDKLFAQKGVEVFIKRDDLSHKDLSGNKFRKLKYNLIEADRLGVNKLLTFGGAFSNHLAAFAFACRFFGFQGLAFVRGNELDIDSNPTLRFAVQQGIKIEFVDRIAYRDKEKIAENYANDYYIIPEGGSNEQALRGVGELLCELNNYDYLVTAMGTGGTFAGLVQYSEKEIIGIPVLKNAGFLKDDVSRLLKTHFPENGKMFMQYHFGGYAKYDNLLIDFIRYFENTHQVQIEQVYTGKAFFGFYDLLRQDYFSQGSTIVLLHTGGLQGRLKLL